MKNRVFNKWITANEILPEVVDKIFYCKVEAKESNINVSFINIDDYTLFMVPVEDRKQFLKICGEFSNYIFKSNNAFFNELFYKNNFTTCNEVSSLRIKTDIINHFKNKEYDENINFKNELLIKLGVKQINKWIPKTDMIVRENHK